MTTFPISTFLGQIAPELDQLRRQMDEIFETGSVPTAVIRSATPRAASTEAKLPAAVAWRPRAALQDGGDRYQLQLQLPGIDASQIEIEARRDGVTVKGDRKAPVSEAQLIHSEFHYGTFERRFRLPEEIQHQQVSAAYTNGILTLTLPKRTAAEDYKVRVEVSVSQAPVEEAEVASAAADSVQPEAVEEAVMSGGVDETSDVVEEPESLW